MNGKSPSTLLYLPLPPPPRLVVAVCFVVCVCGVRAVVSVCIVVVVWLVLCLTSRDVIVRCRSSSAIHSMPLFSFHAFNPLSTASLISAAQPSYSISPLLAILATTLPLNSTVDSFHRIFTSVSWWFALCV